MRTAFAELLEIEDKMNQLEFEMSKERNQEQWERLYEELGDD
ncbi:hypothetical protein [Lederbergia galactosidilytica]|nr:hypothetical protein [Lederbergia galactosidilytica]